MISLNSEHHDWFTLPSFPVHKKKKNSKFVVKDFIIAIQRSYLCAGRLTHGSSLMAYTPTSLLELGGKTYYDLLNRKITGSTLGLRTWTFFPGVRVATSNNYTRSFSTLKIYDGNLLMEMLQILHFFVQDSHLSFIKQNIACKDYLHN